MHLTHETANYLSVIFTYCKKYRTSALIKVEFKIMIAYKMKLGMVTFTLNFFLTCLFQTPSNMLAFTVLVLGVLAQQTFADEPEAIVGGTQANPGEFPYQCSLRVNGQHICGCSIISANRILTAAHCLDGVVPPPYNRMTVVTGTLSNRFGGTTHVVKYGRMHPNYVPKQEQSWVNDIAVLVLQGLIQYNSYQSPVQLATSPPVPGTTCVLSGWGRTSANGPLSTTLLKMNTSIVDKATCQRAHSRQPLYDSHVCAFTRAGIGACSGDSGGPLVCKGRQTGVVSFSLPCALGVPDVYTNVHHHLSFIDSVQ